MERGFPKVRFLYPLEVNPGGYPIISLKHKLGYPSITPLGGVNEIWKSQRSKPDQEHKAEQENCMGAEKGVTAHVGPLETARQSSGPKGDAAAGSVSR